MIANAAGCGSGMREYGLLFAGEPEEAHGARAGGSRAVDVSAFLDELGLATPPAGEPLRVAYHDACHLAHAQRVREAPRRLLEAAGHEVVSPTSGSCAAGRPGPTTSSGRRSAAELGRRKAENLRATGADVVAAGNIGCLTQIRRYLDLPVRHTIQILDGA